MTAAGVMEGQRIFVRAHLSRIALLYLLAGYCGCVALLSAFLPWWILPLAVLCVSWRLLIFAGRASYPGLLPKLVLVGLVGAGLLWQFGYSISLEFFVAMLLAGFSLKLLEITRRQDAQRLLYLAFFVLMTFFLFQQGLAASLLAFMHVVILLAALVALYADDEILATQYARPLKKSVTVFLWAMPVMLFMFLVMPRLPPLWAMPLQKQQAATGMSEDMHPGDISQLTRSAEVVFRATFSDAMPAATSMYWQALALDSFDGERWYSSCGSCDSDWKPSTRMSQPPTTGQQYQVILEPQGSPWLFVLPATRINDEAVLGNGEGLYRYQKKIDERVIYGGYHALPVDVALPLSESQRQRYTRLPEQGNSQARQLAAGWQQQYQDHDAIVQTALQYFSRNFSYTLQPPLLGQQRIDDFLFVSRKGFCEHFASSFAFLMRAAGVPARVVMGYQGGEAHRDPMYVTVRQYDAHAWTEVWLENRGWMRVDPTSVVAPDRLDQGFEQVFADSPALNRVLSLQRYRGMPLMNRLRLQLDRMDYLWSRWVLGYENETQEAVLRKLGLLSPWRMALWVGTAIALAFSGASLFLYWRARRVMRMHPLLWRYRQLCNVYAQYGCERRLPETPRQYAQRVVAADLPCAMAFAQLSADYDAWCYGHAVTDLRQEKILLHNARSIWWRIICHRLFWRSKINTAQE